MPLILLISLSLTVRGQVLFDLPDSLQIKDTIAIATWEGLKYVKFEDSVSIYERHLYRPESNVDLFSLGLEVNGGGHQSSIFTLDQRPGLIVGYHPMPMLRWTPDDLRFYRSNVTYSKVSASLGTSYAHSSRSMQENAQATAMLTRDFAHNVNVSLQYKSINEKGLYRQDRSNHDQVMLQINQWNRKKSFFWYSAWIRNAFNREDNGGIANASFLNDSLYVLRENIPTTYSESTWRDASNLFHLGWQWQLNTSSSRPWVIKNLSSYQERHYKYANPNINELDTLFQPLILLGEGLRSAWHLRSWSNDAQLRWNSRTFRKINAGFVFDHTQLNDEIQDHRLTYGTLYGNVEMNLRNLFLFSGHAHLETLQDVGDFDIGGHLTLQWHKLGLISFESAFGRQNSSFAQQYLSTNGYYQYQRHLPATQYVKLGGNLEIKNLGLQIGIYQYVLNQFNYFNEDFEVVTASEVESISQLKANWQWHWGRIYFLHSGFIQILDEKIWALPRLQTRHILFFQGRLKKNGMDYRLGVDGQLQKMDFAPRLMNINGVFIPSNISIPNGTIYRVDPFIQLDIEGFSAFLKAENFQSLWWESPFIPIVQRPVFDWMFRWGIQWKFLN